MTQTLTTEQIQDIYEAAVREEATGNPDESGAEAFDLLCMLDTTGGTGATIRKLIDMVRAANREAQPVEWGSPKTVGQLIGQLKTLDPEMETTALLRMPADILDGKAVRRVPISISFERLDGQWLATYKGDGRKVLAFWAKADHREEEERGELFTAPPAPAVPDAITSANAPEVFEMAAEVERLGLRGAYGAYAAGWNACRAAMLAQPVSQGYKFPDDTRRMDWLVAHYVAVRKPLLYGSKEMFIAQTMTDEEDDYHATSLREQIDAAMLAAALEGGGKSK